MKTSRTAEQVALFRALETARRQPRLFEDPYAVGFLSRPYRLVATLARIPAVGWCVDRYIDSRWPAGPRASAIVRTRLIDDLVGEAFENGVQQVVLLGAGYDSRAYRLPAMATTRVYEVDHPATQATKRRRLAATRRDHVRFVGVDLIHDDLGAALREAGYRGDDRTVVVWEGVTNYLTAAAVDSTVRDLAELTSPGSRIIMTYVDSSALDGTGGFDGVAEWHHAVSAGGEPWTFGFDPAELDGYLSERRMMLRLDLSARDAAVRYLAPLHRDEPAAPFYRIAMAERMGEKPGAATDGTR